MTIFPLKYKYMSKQKIVLLGDENTGKTSLLNRIVNPRSSFEPDYISTSEVSSQMFERETSKYGLIEGEIWDHPGDLMTLSRTQDFLSSYFDNANGIVLMYDVTDKESFEHLTTRWITMFEDHSKASKFYSTPKILVGNKMDLSNREIPIRDINKFCKNLNNIVHYEVSALTGGGVQIAFEALMKEIQNKNISKVTRYHSPTSIVPQQNFETVEFDWNIPNQKSIKKSRNVETKSYAENVLGINFACDASRILCYSDDF